MSHFSGLKRFPNCVWTETIVIDCGALFKLIFWIPILEYKFRCSWKRNMRLYKVDNQAFVWVFIVCFSCCVSDFTWRNSLLFVIKPISPKFFEVVELVWNNFRGDWICGNINRVAIFFMNKIVVSPFVSLTTSTPDMSVFIKVIRVNCLLKEIKTTRVENNEVIPFLVHNSIPVRI